MIDLAAIATLTGMVIPPLTDFIKKKFIKQENDTPDRTMGTLATTKPEVLPEYIKSLCEWQKAQTDFFNRDLVPGGMPSQWIVDLRAAIRPVSVALSFLLIGLDMYAQLGLDPGVKASMCANIGHWFGGRSL